MTRFERDKEVLFDLLAEDTGDNYTECNLLSCRNCIFDKYGACIELKKEYLNEEV